MKHAVQSILLGCALFLALGAATAMGQKVKTFTVTNPSGLAGLRGNAKAC